MFIKTITPVHIGNGNQYDPMCLYDNKVYSMDDLLSLVDISKLRDKTILNKLSSNDSAISREEFNNLLGLKNINYNNFNYLYEVDNQINDDKYTNYKTNEITKSLFNPIIPGSTLKGYIRSVITYDILSNKESIRNDFENKFKESKKNKRGPFDNDEINGLYRYLIVSDFSFSEKPLVLNAFRTSKDNEICFNIEVIPSNVCSNESRIIIDKRINEIESSYYDTKTKENKQHSGFFMETLKRIKNFNSCFKEANKKFISYVLEKERESIGYIYFPDDKCIDEYESFLDKIEKMVNEGRIIMQIGKYTNFIDKSISHIYDNYEDDFQDLYSPNKAEKIEPIIESINLIGNVSNKENAFKPLGFIELTLWY